MRADYMNWVQNSVWRYFLVSVQKNVNVALIQMFILEHVKHLRCNVMQKQLAFSCSKLTIETLKQEVKYVQS